MLVYLELNRKIITCLTFVAAIQFYVHAKNDTIPTWLDTIPPEISIDPINRYHSSMFNFSFEANKRSIIWFAINSKEKFEQYTGPVPITNDGKYIIYFYGEDDFTNKSIVDSIRYVFDQKPPQLTISPSSGVFAAGTVLHLKTDERCTFYLLKSQSDLTGEQIADSMILDKNLSGYISAIDSCGNKAISEYVNIKIETQPENPALFPDEGIYKKPQKMIFQTKDSSEIYYTFDAVQPQQWFTRYYGPAGIPYGLTILRYYAKSKSGLVTEVFRRKFIIDTIPPEVTAHISKGENEDTIELYTKEQSTIRYETNRINPSVESSRYSVPIIAKHKGKYFIMARAWDLAGNESDIFKWECKYDFDAPVLKISNNGGSFKAPQRISITSNEPAKIFYTLDGSKTGSNSILYNNTDGIIISREDSTTLRYYGIDDAGNMTEEKTAHFYIDTHPPQLKVRISGKMADGRFQVQITSDEPSEIHYTIDGTDPGIYSPVYTSSISINSGKILKYFAIDKSGNESPIAIMNELKKPRVEAIPDGGIYNKKIKISFESNSAGTIQWRLLPDADFRPLTEPVLLDKEGLYSLEYYLESADGSHSPMRRNEYSIDWTAPNVQVELKKGTNDSVIVFFEASENATIYYTTDGSNPIYNPEAKTAGNKYLQLRDRIVIARAKDTRLAFYAEDVAKNQSSVSILDVMSPRAVPNVPAGKEKLYDRILSITLNTINQSTIYYCRHGHIPSTDSAVFSEPITLLESDTIVDFVVDASGYQGQKDTLIYLLDLPPSPQFKITNDTIYAGKPVYFDASESIDKETPFDKLLFKWDFDGDGKFDTELGKLSKTTHNYSQTGNYTVILEIVDGNNRKSQISKSIMVLGVCPSDMASINSDDGHNFCIDIYEYPNLQYTLPQTNISWVEAKIACIDAGKRLCTAEEWASACHGINKTAYPYGHQFQFKKCPTEGTKLYKSGSFRNCSDSKVKDMIGNAWEWVEDKNGDYPGMYGGSYKYGKDAHCGLRADGYVASRSGEVGFRCCK